MFIPCCSLAGTSFPASIPLSGLVHGGAVSEGAAGALRLGVPEDLLVEGVRGRCLGGEPDHLVPAGPVVLAALGVLTAQDTRPLPAVWAEAVGGFQYQWLLRQCHHCRGQFHPIDLACREGHSVLWITHLHSIDQFCNPVSEQVSAG